MKDEDGQKARSSCTRLPLVMINGRDSLSGFDVMVMNLIGRDFIYVCMYVVGMYVSLFWGMYVLVVGGGEVIHLQLT